MSPPYSHNTNEQHSPEYPTGATTPTDCHPTCKEQVPGAIMFTQSEACLNDGMHFVMCQYSSYDYHHPHFKTLPLHEKIFLQSIFVQFVT